MKRALAVCLFLAACGGKSSSTQTAPLEQAATCQDIGDRAAQDVKEDLPPSAPEDFGPKFGAMITRLCTEDQWPQEVITCGMTAEDPRKECSPQLSDAQRAHLDDEQMKMSAELATAMGAIAGTDLVTPTGMEHCDQLRAYGAEVRDCPNSVVAMGEDGLAQLVGGLAILSQVPEKQKADVDAQCESKVGDLIALLDQLGCGAGE